jgi:hypothetical protein
MFFIIILVDYGNVFFTVYLSTYYGDYDEADWDQRKVGRSSRRRHVSSSSRCVLWVFFLFFFHFRLYFSGYESSDIHSILEIKNGRVRNKRSSLRIDDISSKWVEIKWETVEMGRKGV